MNKVKVAKQLLVLARELVSMDFDTEEEKKKYEQEHDVRPGTKLTVNKSEPAEKSAPAGQPPKAKKSKPLSRDEADQISTAIRDHLSGTERFTTKELMQPMFRTPSGKKLTDEQFSSVWDGMVKEGYLKKTDNGYRWNNENKFPIE